MKCTSDPARDSSFGITSTATRTPSGAASRCSSSMLRARAVTAVPAGRCCERGSPQMGDQDAKRDPPRDLERALGFLHGPRPCFGIGAGQGDRRPPAAGREAFTNRCVHGVQLEPGFRQPLLQVRDRGRVVIVEMRPRREELDRLEPVRRDLQQVLPAQPVIVIQVRRDTELSRTSISFR